RRPVDASLAPSRYARMFPELPSISADEAFRFALGRAGGLCDCRTEEDDDHLVVEETVVDRPTSKTSEEVGIDLCQNFNDVRAVENVLSQNCHTSLNVRRC